MFLERYQLSDDEHAALESEELDQRFFAAVEKVRLIHERCKVLLRTREQNAGLSIMEAMASLQVRAVAVPCCVTCVVPARAVTLAVTVC